MSAGVLIAGGGLAAQRCCEALRKARDERPIRMICAEGHAPYDRPPLSKGVLAGTVEIGEIAFRASDWYEEQRVELLPGRSATALDPGARTVSLDDGAELAYEQLLIATGAVPRRLELLQGHANVHYLRTADDAIRLRHALGPGRRLVVIGAGFIGQEVAATARGLGAEVVMLEALPTPLGRMLGDEIGAWFATLHRDHGVDVRCSTTAAEAVVGADGRVTALITGEGHTIGCDEIVVGIGVMPADEWLYGSGLGGGHVGVEVDVGGRTAAPAVFAAGDVARPFDQRLGAHVRTEHWEAAARQGAGAARAMLGLEVPTPPLASFWSDQYGVRVQYLGYAAEADAVAIEGDSAGPDLRAVWTREGRAVAALLVGRPREMPALRRAIDETFEPIIDRSVTP
jgi:NADPH-dependent 2,4-dienoyl-CoA reductase/sulfur reductase-like enzyme